MNLRVNALRPEQNSRRFANNIFFLKEKFDIVI